MSADDYMAAIMNEDEDEGATMIAEIVATGAPLNKTMTNGFTPLFWAILHRSYEVAKMMIHLGADIYMPAGPGDTGSVADVVYKQRAAGSKEFREFLAERIGDPYFAQFARKKGEREATIARAAATFADRGPICDTEGYYQHQGECWNDTLQMLLMFTDGIKEITQPLILAKTSEQLIPAATPNRKNVVIYMDTIRHRFARHYLNEIDRRERCDLRGSRRAHGLNTFTGAVAMGKAPLEDIPREYSTAKTYQPTHQIKPYLDMFMNMFGFKPRIQITVAGPEQILNPRTLLALSLIYMYKDGRGHINTFYTCGGVDYWYDDYIGVYNMPWRDLLVIQRRGKGKWIAVKHVALNTTVYPALYFPEDKVTVYVDVLKSEYKALKDGEEDGVIKRTDDYTFMHLFPMVDTQMGHGPAREPVLPVLVGRAAHAMPYRPANRNLIPLSPNTSEELPELLAPKPFLLPMKPRRSAAGGGGGGGGGGQKGSGRRRTKRNR